MAAYYNEIDRYCCDWLSNLMDAGKITPGKIDDRSIVDVRPDDVAGHERVHFFAGIGGWDYALQLAGWSGPVWTGSCPCQPFSQAGKLGRFSDPRHLWPTWARLIDVGRPSVVFGEQVASATEWLRLVRGDLEALGYAVGCAPIEAASSGAEEFGDRFWFVAASTVEDDRRANSEESAGQEPEPGSRFRSSDDRCGQVRVLGRLLPDAGIPLLAHEIPARLDQYRAFGNAIDPVAASKFISAAIGAMTLSLSQRNIEVDHD